MPRDHRTSSRSNKTDAGGGAGGGAGRSKVQAQIQAQVQAQAQASRSKPSSDQGILISTLEGVQGRGKASSHGTTSKDSGSRDRRRGEKPERGSKSSSRDKKPSSDRKEDPRNKKDDREGRTRVSDARRSEERRRTEEKSRSRVDKRESERDRHSNSKSKSKTRDEEKESNARRSRDEDKDKDVKVERKRSGSQSNSRDSTANRRTSGSRPSSLKDKEAIFNAVFNAPRPEKVTERRENGGEKGRDEEVDEVAEEEDDDEAPEEDFNYDEDEFEDYDDDDFEEEPEEEGEGEGEEENDVKMDSGNYDRRSMMERARMEQEMREVKQAMVRENTAKGARARRRPDGDEGARGDGAHGGDISMSDDSGEGSPKVEGNDEESSVKRQRLKSARAGGGFVNFSTAKERQKTQLAAGKARRRGDELLAMIRLDVVAFDLMELPPIRYEAFMKTFGATNTMQAISQTGEDNLQEEVQTDPVDTAEMWTQKPPAAVDLKGLDGDHEQLLQSIRGVGGQVSRSSSSSTKSWEFSTRSDSVRLSKFLGAAAPAILTLLEEESLGDGPAGQVNKDVAFSDKVTLLNTDLPFLEDKSVTALCFAADQPSIMLSAHSSSDELGKSYVCVWNVTHPSAPSKVLVASGGVTACCFSPLKASVAIAGLVDGTVCAWDLREAFSFHQEVARSGEGDDQDVFRSPTFTTNSAENGHSSAVTAIKPLPEPQDDGRGGRERAFAAAAPNASGFVTFQLVTIEERGALIVWTVLDGQRDVDQHIGLAHWGSVRLVSTMVLDLRALLMGTKGAQQLGPEVNSFDVTFDPGDGSRVYVGTENGTVLHASVQSADHRPNPRSFKPDLDVLSAAVRSLSFCPFGEGYMLAGSDDGSVRLHATTNERPLITWPGTVDGQPIVKLVWSMSRPCVFVVLDTASRIHLWDLGSGDIYPAHTVQFEEDIETIALSPDDGDTRQPQILALAMKSGKIELHTMKEEYKAEDDDACDSELARFLHYVNII